MQYLLGFGSNHGDRETNLNTALFILVNYGIRFIAVSNIYESKALLLPNSSRGWDRAYLNAVAIIVTTLAPEEMLILCKKVEIAMGRNLQAERWSPRVIDIDILMIKGNIVIEHKELSVPHVELPKRLFVLLPAAEIAPGWYHIKNGCSLRELSLRLLKQSGDHAVCQCRCTGRKLLWNYARNTFS